MDERDKTRPQDQHRRQEGQEGGVLETLGRMFALRQPEQPRGKLQVKETIDRASSDPAAMPQPAPKVPSRRQYETFAVGIVGGGSVEVEAGASPDYWMVYAQDITKFTAGNGVLIAPQDAPLTNYLAGVTGGNQVIPNAGQYLNGNFTYKIPGRGRKLQLLMSAAPAFALLYVTACTNVEVSRE